MLQNDGSAVDIAALDLRIRMAARCRGVRITEGVGRAKHRDEPTSTPLRFQGDDSDPGTTSLSGVLESDRSRPPEGDGHVFAVGRRLQEVGRRIVQGQRRVVGDGLVETRPLALGASEGS